MLSGNDLKPSQRVHSENNPRRVGTVRYIGPLEGYTGVWVGVDWDGGDAKHDGSLNGTRYFQARSNNSASFLRPNSLCAGISFLEALNRRYCEDQTDENEDEMYVLSTSNKHISVQLVGKEKIRNKISRFDELTTVSLSSMGVSGAGDADNIKSTVPNIKELDLSQNLLSHWKDVETICEQLPQMQLLNLSNNMLDPIISLKFQLSSIRILVLNNTGLSLNSIESVEHLLPSMEELHLVGNCISYIEPKNSSYVEGFESLKILNLDDNFLAEWDEVLKLSFLPRLEQLHLDKNKLKQIDYPENNTIPFKNLHSLLLGGNNINHISSVDSLNLFPQLVEARLSENPVADPSKGGLPRYVLIAILPNIKVLNGSEVSARERRDSEIRFVRRVLTNCEGDIINKHHPRFAELKRLHCIEEEGSTVNVSGPQKMSSGLISLTLKFVGPSGSHKQPLVKKFPATTSVGKLKMLCESFFKVDSGKLKVFLQEAGSPLPTFLDDDYASLLDAGVADDSVILLDE